MPDIFRLPFRFDCSGIDLVHPIDRMPPGSYPYLFNVRILEEGRLEGRPGYSQFIQLLDSPNSIRRLNSPGAHLYIGGGGTKLYAGQETSYNPVDTGYSGDPLSLIPFRPEQSPAPWMYVYDRLKSTKIKTDLTLRSIGIVPPSKAPTLEYGVPADVDITTGQSTAGWSATGGSSGPLLTDRTNGSTPSIVSITYGSGGIGWACINPNITQPFWMGSRMKVILNPGGGNQETVVVRDVLSAIQNTTIADIQYDAGTSGSCSLVLNGSPSGLERNSLIELDSEVVRVLAVIKSPTGTDYSIRCSTTLTHSAGAPVTGLISWFVYTVQPHANGELIASNYLQMAHTATGTGSAQSSVGVNASAANGRPIDPANDYLHISLFLQNPQNVTNIQLLLSLDVTPNFSFTNPGNSYIFTITQAELDTQGSSGNSWVEVVVPISSANRSGSDLTRTLANISGIAIQMISTGACAWGFDWWYLFGTYGQVIQPNSPVGVAYQSRFRDVTTGAHSVPGPLNRFQLFPLRESVIITPPTSTQPGVDTIDIYRIGGTVTSPLYVGGVENNPSLPNSYTDGLPDSAVLSINQSPDLGALQPWPILSTPLAGTVSVTGTSIEWISGDQFPTSLIGNTIILINGVAFLTYGQPRSATFLELTQDAGFFGTAAYQIASPTLAGQALPFAFGPLEGPFAPVIFALGDPINGGLLYFSNFNDADSASDINTLELSTPSSDLVSGAVWNGLCLTGDRDSIYCVRFTYLTSIGASNNTSFQWARVGSAPSGIWSRWACCTCPIGMAYLGRDGIYITTDSSTVNITDDKLYPLFPHDGVPARAVNSGSNIILPVDMTKLTKLRLSYCDEALRFSYQDTGGNYNTLIYEIYKKRWLLNNYANAISYHYLVEETATEGPNDQEILMLSLDTNSIALAGDDSDGGHDINSIVLTPSMDGGDERAQKLYVDAMILADGTGKLEVAAAYDSAQSFSPVFSVTYGGVIFQTYQNLASLANLSLFKNIGAKFAWVGGPSGPRLYAWEPSGFMQPYLGRFFVTQFIPFSFPGWKHMRRMYPALISNKSVNMTIKTQDGRTFGPYVIPSTGGQYRILPQMLDAGIKDLAFALQMDGDGHPFAFFPNDFTVEVKEWREETYINLAVFKA